MAEYQVVLSGGDNIAVIPVGTPIDPGTLRVYLYDTSTGRWLACRHVQSVLAHGNGWVEPPAGTTITIDQPLPEPIRAEGPARDGRVRASVSRLRADAALQRRRWNWALGRTPGTGRVDADDEVWQRYLRRL